MARIAVVMLNLGGPDGPAAVEPFLFNLFNDKAIISAPQPLRWLLARLISRRRAPIAREIYGKIGGGSPTAGQTPSPRRGPSSGRSRDRRGKGLSLHAILASDGGGGGPGGGGVFRPDRIILLPLYPQFFISTTTASSSGHRVADRGPGRLAGAGQLLCCYPGQPGMVKALSRPGAGRGGEAQAAGSSAPRVLFSAHGLPKRIVDRGDPYPIR